ncbi:alpha-hydroxy acid oxidase [Achromobacter xylosoxidans]|uniref:alpha-hydroxy acid oxidase n=1 Tax=Alcaligenes xylosoxydans xylosoxydans TaxID=85698 RepID=UPI0006C31EED|nr:alpha-hydroxy acid oxidase [Achromobacter xylosoxidans]MCH4576710.1 alpha-hydroxy-acid oxidizing protein [Achromobacter xylosoxidans]MDD7991785.1 alpha-hydroxy acid oxidase [Achromobacter xylosoxidans]MDZ5615990.1 alpha-hydroxy acid oxidase [Achromobacter xylosoxidans]MDZ5627247.1 alpha-hydroxy acid oxidase [Achromobacter xylosoxidans]MDZ5687466.1 alpha-hydroxy acid oxidase [Achromobacter xylosoxidans]
MSDPLRRMLSLHDFEAAARRILPKPLYAYVSGAVEDGQSERGNRQAYDDYGFRPKVLVDVSRRGTRCTVLGREYAAPVGVAPMGIAALTSYRGDVMLARAAAEAGVPCIMSGSSLIRLETVMEAAPGTWFQAYLPGDGAQIAALIDRVAAAGVDTLVLTVDTPVAANRENNVRAGFSTPLRPSVGLAWQGVTHPRWLIGTFLRTLARHGMPHFENNYATRGAPILSGNVLRDFSDRGHLNWQHVAAIRKTWKGRMVLKGILHPDDARAARAHGMDAVIVSNHGGRQLDGSVSPLHALPAIVDAAGGMDVMLDSGVRRGTDALKAMALGARCVFVGRPFNYAATVAGQRGVAHAIALIVEEIRRNMGLLGIVDLRELNQSLLQRSR